MSIFLAAVFIYIRCANTRLNGQQRAACSRTVTGECGPVAVRCCEIEIGLSGLPSPTMSRLPTTYSDQREDTFCHAMLSINAAYNVVRCLSCVCDETAILAIERK